MGSLTDVLREVLEPQGFKRNRSGRQYARTIDGVMQVVGLRKSRAGRGWSQMSWTISFV